MVTPGGESVTGGRGRLESFRGYARHRGVSAPSVLRAIKSGRLDKSVGRDASGKAVGIADVALADAEWLKNTDISKAPTYIKERAAARSQETPAPARPTAPAVTAPAAVTPPVTPTLPAPTDVDAEPPPTTVNDALIQEKIWRTKLLEQEFRKNASELVEANEVESALAADYALCRTRLLAIASKGKTVLGLNQVQTLGLDRLIREACEGLASVDDQQQGAA